MKTNIVIIGSGNVAWHLSGLFTKSGHSIRKVISKSIKHAADLALKTGSAYGDDPGHLPQGTDVVMIAVNDESIKEVAQELPAGDHIIAHTSGSVPMEALSNHPYCGVFYPLQTFRKSHPLPDGHIPVCIEGSTVAVCRQLTSLASSITKHIYQLSSAQRIVVHLAAVFASNFTNQMYAIAKTLLDENQLSFDMMQPLIRETAGRISEGSPERLQTGPAVRGDMSVMNKHLKLLQNHSDYQKIYTLVSKIIQEQLKR